MLSNCFTNNLNNILFLLKKLGRHFIFSFLKDYYKHRGNIILMYPKLNQRHIIQVKKHSRGQACALIPAPRRRRQVNLCKFKASPLYKERLCLKSKQTKTVTRRVLLLCNIFTIYLFIHSFCIGALSACMCEGAKSCSYRQW